MAYRTTTEIPPRGSHSHSLTKRVHEIPKRETRFRASVVSQPTETHTRRPQGIFRDPEGGAFTWRVEMERRDVEKFRESTSVNWNDAFWRRDNFMRGCIRLSVFLNRNGHRSFVV